MKKQYIFIFLLAFLVFLVVQFLSTVYHNSRREDLLLMRKREIARDEEEIGAMLLRAQWGDTIAARIFQKKLNWNVRLPGEKVWIMTPSPAKKYQIDTAISEAQKKEEEQNALSIPEKWHLLFQKQHI